MTGSTRNLNREREAVMIGIVSLISVTAGAVAAYFAERLPQRAEAIETGAGFLLIGGFALLGSALPIIL
jgi:putative Mn2+ efflux pump MntP